MLFIGGHPNNGSPMPTAHPREEITVIRDFLVEGTRGVYVPCFDYDAYKALPMALEFCGVVMGRTGWNSDLGWACYQDNALLATPK